MIKNKSLAELGKEYETSAMQIKRRITEKRQKLRSLKDSVLSNEAYEIKRELRLLYEEYRDTKEIAEYLKTYYEPHNGRREIFKY